MKKKQRSASTTSTSRGSAVASKPRSSITAPMSAFLSQWLPGGSFSGFRLRRAGRYAGIVCACPHCGEVAPRELKWTHRKWRWMTVHVARCTTRRAPNE